MKFVTVQVQNEWLAADSRLKRLMGAVDAYCLHNFKIEILVTDVLRQPPPPTPHEDGRACDLRSIGAFTDEQRKQLLAWVNLSFPYGPSVFETAKYERKGQVNPNGSVATNDHFHFQVRPL